MRGYTVKKCKNGKLIICKILNTYEANQEELVLEILSKLVTNQITEEDLLRELGKKDITK